MADFAAHLRDRVMPHVPVRQWVLTAPFDLRFGMAFDPALAGVVLRTFVGVVSHWLRRRARAHGRGAAVFHPVPAPTAEEVAAVTEQVYRKVARLMDARGDDESSAFASAEPVLATLAGASVAGVAATGPRRGARTLRLGSGTAPAAIIASRRCATVEGFSLHANVRVGANDRDGLEHLARYLARPPIATDRLTALPDGRVVLRFKRPFSDGTAATVRVDRAPLTSGAASPQAHHPLPRHPGAGGRL